MTLSLPELVQTLRLPLSAEGGTLGSGTDATDAFAGVAAILVARGGGVLVIPPGNWRITAPVKLNGNNISVVGYGDASTVYMDEDDSGGVGTGAFWNTGMFQCFTGSVYTPGNGDWSTSPAFTNLHFRDFRIVGNNTTPIIDNWQSAGIDFSNGSDDCSVTNVTFENLRGFPVHARGEAVRHTVTNNRMINCGNGLNDNSDYSTFSNNVCTAIEGFECAGAGIAVVGNVLESCGRGNLGAMSIGGNIGVGADKPGAMISANVLHNCTGGITIADAATSSVVLGNAVIASGGYGIQVGGGAVTNPPNRVSILGNVLTDIGDVDTPGGAAIGIWIYNADDCIVSNNVIRRTDGAAHTDHGIYIYNSDRTTVVANSANASTSAYLLRDSADVVFENNVKWSGAVTLTGTVTFKTPEVAP